MQERVIPMNQTVTPPGNPFHAGSSYRDHQLRQEQWQFYSNANHDRWMRTRNAGVTGDYGGGGYGGGGYGGGYAAQHQSTAGEGLFALAVILGIIAVVVVVAVFVVRMVLSLINRVVQ